MTIRGAFKNASAAPSPTIRSQSWIIAGTVTGCAFGPLIFSRTASAGSLGVFPSSHRVVHCAAATTLPGANNIQLNASLEKEPLINTKELTFGMVMGLCSGYLFKKLGRMMMIVVGLGFVWMQLLSSSGYIQVNWPLIERRFKETFDLDKDGKVTMNDARHGFRLLLELLTKNFQFKATYVGGYIMGFRYG
ncbi:hypothetical protein BGX31_000030 [Mortierella sp. GBA43]|nr:hypothetical protein BGX31_000030 [Mortierella sp. GBA43]